MEPTVAKIEGPFSKIFNYNIDYFTVRIEDKMTASGPVAMGPSGAIGSASKAATDTAARKFEV